ncbi:ImmA/IrrE family metallo-endopeptidase [Pseudalkalibacillus sp. A8]|uniref:ImmA/IrrE family metallo-endopeptidase n=1 Tax=Pseudalkalibacillus sp. A8 TaxID=3382641 RepID=UPI0038B5D7F4
MNRYFHLKENFIAIYKERNPKQQLKTLIHEYADNLLHSKEAKFKQEESRIKEAQAEVVAYVVFHHFGYDTGKYS